jgi:hypothetical protein
LVEGIPSKFADPLNQAHNKFHFIEAYQVSIVDCSPPVFKLNGLDSVKINAYATGYAESTYYIPSTLQVVTGHRIECGQYYSELLNSDIISMPTRDSTVDGRTRLDRSSSYAYSLNDIVTQSQTSSSIINPSDKPGLIF